MKKSMYLLVVGIALCVSVSAQSELTYKSEVFQSGIFQNETKLNANQVKEVMSGNSEALVAYNSGRSLLIMGQVIAYPCAFLLGWETGARLGSGEGNNTLLVVSAVGTATGLIMAIFGEKKIKNSVSLYNSKANINSASYQVNFGFKETSKNEYRQLKYLM